MIFNFGISIQFTNRVCLFCWVPLVQIFLFRIFDNLDLKADCSITAELERSIPKKSEICLTVLYQELLAELVSF